MQFRSTPMAEGTRPSKTSVESSLSQAVKTFIAKMKSLCKKKSTTPKVMMPLADKTCHLPPSQAVETETLCNEKSTTQGYSVAEAAVNGFDKSKVLTYEDLQLLSKNFSPYNYMGRTQFGLLYKGIIPEGSCGSTPMAEGTRSSKTSVESTLSQAVKTVNAKMKSLYKKKSTTPKVMMPPADKTSPIPSSQAAETETPCNEKSTTQVAKAAAIVFDKAKVLSYKDLQLLSNDFSPDNYMGWTQFGHLYKGIIPEDWGRMRSGEVTIKMWKYEEFVDEDIIVPDDPYLIRHRMEQEIRFLQQPDIAMHPYTVKVMGYCLEFNNLGVVYDLKPLHTLKKYIDNEKFGWLERVDVAVKLACVLKLFHEHVPQYIVRNLSPAHVMLDQDLNPVLIDYAMIHGGSFVDLLPMQQGGPYGYVSVNELCIGGTTKRNDIHGYGVILLEILRRCTYGNNRELENGSISTNEFAWMDYVRYQEKQDEKADGSGDAEEENSLYSFAHKSMRNDPDYEAVDGNKISRLALRCVEKVKPNIYSMGAVLKELKALNVVQRELLFR